MSHTFCTTVSITKDCEKLERDLDSVSSWCGHWQMNLSPLKCKLLCINFTWTPSAAVLKWPPLLIIVGQFVSFILFMTFYIITFVLILIAISLFIIFFVSKPLLILFVILFLHSIFLWNCVSYPLLIMIYLNFNCIHFYLVSRKFTGKMLAIRKINSFVN